VVTRCVPEIDLYWFYMAHCREKHSAFVCIGNRSESLRFQEKTAERKRLWNRFRREKAVFLTAVELFPVFSARRFLTLSRSGPIRGGGIVMAEGY